MTNIFGSRGFYLFIFFATLFLSFVDGESGKCKHPKEKITKKLLHLIEDPIEVSQIIHFLTKQEEIYGSYQNSPSWTNLCNVYDWDPVFTQVAHLLNKDEEKRINEHVNKLYEEFHLVLLEAKDSIPDDVKFSDLLAGSALSMDKILNSLSPTVKSKVLSKIPNAYALKTVGTSMMLKPELLSAVYLSYETFYNIYRWWNGEISASRATKNIIDSMAAVGGGAAGASFGATFGSVFGPIGSAVGGALGAITGSLTASHYSETFTRWIFDLPKTEALEKAYNVFGISHDAPNYEVNKAFRSLCKRYHPDAAGGSHENFTEIQYYMTIIKAARGEKHIF